MSIELARLAGVVARWNDERGFGFIVPSLGYDDVFVHISAFPPALPRPVDGDRVTFAITHDVNGRQRASDIRYQQLVPRRTAKMPLRRLSASGGVALAVFLSICIYGLLSLNLSVYAIGAYVIMSVASFALYAKDKAAATSGGWRISEATLLLSGLLCGWPGAVIAQDILRHKTKKQPFRTVFWGSVLVNLAILLAFATTEGQEMLGVLLSDFLA